MADQTIEIENEIQLRKTGEGFAIVSGKRILGRFGEDDSVTLRLPEGHKLDRLDLRLRDEKGELVEGAAPKRVFIENQGGEVEVSGVARVKTTAMAMAANNPQNAEKRIHTGVAKLENNATNPAHRIDYAGNVVAANDGEVTFDLGGKSVTVTGPQPQAKPRKAELPNPAPAIENDSAKGQSVDQDIQIRQLKDGSFGVYSAKGERLKSFDKNGATLTLAEGFNPKRLDLEIKDESGKNPAKLDWDHTPPIVLDMNGKTVELAGRKLSVVNGNAIVRTTAKELAGIDDKGQIKFPGGSQPTMPDGGGGGIIYEGKEFDALRGDASGHPKSGAVKFEDKDGKELLTIHGEEGADGAKDKLETFRKETLEKERAKAYLKSGEKPGPPKNNKAPTDQKTADNSAPTQEEINAAYKNHPGLDNFNVYAVIAQEKKILQGQNMAMAKEHHLETPKVPDARGANKNLSV